MKTLEFKIFALTRRGNEYFMRARARSFVEALDTFMFAVALNGSHLVGDVELVS